jgi:hypothetical protein
VDVCLGVFWWLNLNNQVNRRNVKSSSCDISCHEHAKFLFFKSLKRDLSLVLGNVTVHHFNVFFDFVGKEKLICFRFGARKNDCLASAAVANKDVCKRSYTVVVGDVDGKMRYRF